MSVFCYSDLKGNRTVELSLTELYIFLDCDYINIAMIFFLKTQKFCKHQLLFQKSCYTGLIHINIKVHNMAESTLSHLLWAVFNGEQQTKA